MEYTTVKETAKKWGVTDVYVRTLCKDGRIPGVIYTNKRWRIPVNAKKPERSGVAGTRSVPAVAKEWGISSYSVIRLCELGEIPGAVHIGRSWYVPEGVAYPLQGYLSAPKMAEKWKIARANLWQACKEGRVPGAKRVGRDWYIPTATPRLERKPPDQKPGYVFAEEMAEKWGVSRKTVCDAARTGRIPGAENINRRWYIPKDAEKPKNISTVRKAGYLSASEVAEKLGISRPSVLCAAKEGRIPGAEFIDGFWHIPEDIEKLTDNRVLRKAGYLSASKMAEEWGVSRSAVCRFCREGRIHGAEQINGKWHIPEDAVCPDNRRGKRK